MESLNVRFNAQFSADLVNALSFNTITDSVSLPVVVALANGTGAGQANQIFNDQRTLAGSANESINVVNFNGSLDGVGGAFSMSRIKAIIVQNLHVTETNNLQIGGAGAGAITTPFNGNSSYLVTVPGGSTFIALSPGAT